MKVKIKDLLHIGNQVNSITWEELETALIQLIVSGILTDPTVLALIQSLLLAIAAYNEAIALVQQIQIATAAIKKATKLAIAVIAPPESSEVANDIEIQGVHMAKQEAQTTVETAKTTVLNTEVDIPDEIPSA